MNCRIENKVKFLKGTLVLLVATVMLLSTVGVTADDAGVGTLEIAVLEEGFEDGGPDWPEGWTHIVDNGDWTWQITATEAHASVFSAMCPMRSDEQNEWLISPEIELSGGWEEVTLSFWCFTKIQWDTGTVRVFVGEPSMFAGLPDLPPDPEDAIWDKLADEDWDTEQWREMVFDISEYAGSTVRIAWNYVDEGFQWKFCLDDVLVSTPGYVPKTSLNIGTISGGAGGGVYAEIENTGNISAEDIEWSMSIAGGFMGRINTESSGEIDEIDVGESEFAGLGSRAFFGLGAVTIEVTVEASNTEPSEVSRNATGFVFLNRFFPLFM